VAASRKSIRQTDRLWWDRAPFAIGISESRRQLLQLAIRTVTGYGAAISISRVSARVLPGEGR